jgi:hypothetical protein
MALGYLATEPLAGEKKPLKLLAVDDFGSLRVADRQAELLGLLVRKRPDAKPLTLAACFKYSSEWRVESVGKGPCVF